MKKIYLLTLLAFFLISFAFAQNKPVHFKNGDFRGNNLLTKKQSNTDLLKKLRFQKKSYALIQFSSLPGIEERKEMAAKGILLFDYLPGNAFTAELPDSINVEELKSSHIVALYNTDRQFKISKTLQQHIASNTPDRDKLIAVSFFGTIKKDEVINQLKKAGAQIVFTKLQPNQVVFINAAPSVIEKIADLPFVSYVSEQRMKDEALNYNNRATHGLDALGASSGRNLQGKNVTLGIGDNADPSTHIDFTGRLILRNPTVVSVHGTHTAGTMAGAGILNPMYKGMAPQATIISQYYSDILVNTPVYISDNNMVLTNNSYYSGAAGCQGEGEYDVLSNYVDYQLYTYNNLLHDFASGNDGGLNCTPYSGSFATIKSGFQCGKDVLTVGASNNYNYTIANFSSCGPVNDGRLKPEIVAGGVAITSTYPYNSYGQDNGTSMASPTVTGTLALLYERYRQLHGGSDPSGALIKAIACNSADDMGNPGPDFQFGFGMLNARTSVEAIENNQYFSGSITNGNSTNFSITGVPAGVQQIKVMLYWVDPPAAPYAASTLVNNLDLTVTSPDATLHYPLILNPAANHVNDNAVEGVDNINNIEQVVINNPPAGNFTVSVNGTSVATGTQNFVIAYEIINPSVTVEYPFGNETWVPGSTENIRWSAYGGTGNTFSIDYSTDNGSTWTNISNSVPDASRSYSWTVPNIATNNALIRVTRNNVGYSDVSDYDFTILGQPTITLTNPCQGYAQLSWAAIPSATQYEIMMLQGDSMQTIATTTNTSYTISGLNRDSTYWLTVRADNGTTPGRRAIAASILPNSGACTLNAKDFTVDSLIAPLTGRKFTSTEISNSSNIQVEIKNLGNATSSGSYTMNYQVNGGTVVTETSSLTIPSNAAANYTFITPYDFSAVGTYNIKAWVVYPGDTLNLNDTLNAVVKQLQNDPLTLAPGFTEGFESAAPASYTSPTFGFTGLDRCDFNASNSNGRARTFINTGFARTGNNCATLDQSHYSATSTADSLITTFNLSNYSSSDQIWLNFYYQNQGIDFSLPGNQVWIRGNDQAAWIPVVTLSTVATEIGTYLSSGAIDVTGLLAGASPAQTISSSFQIKFGEQGYTSTNSVLTDGDVDDGYSFDDITFTRSSNDVALTALVSPDFSTNCGFSNTQVIQVKVKNYSTSTLNNIAVTYKINGTTVTENIPTIAAKDSIIYSFSQTYDMSAYQNYNINAWVNYPGDNYNTNDSLLNINFQTTPSITSFPYLEGFESGPGYWYTNGINDSWQWGAPQKTIINRAANGTKAWVTNLTGNYNDNELSYLYSPCFDLSSLTQPVFSFSHIFQTEDDCDCDYHWAEYSTDDVNWVKLGAVGSGTNWYDNATRQAWQLSNTKWHVSSYDVPSHATKVRFRIVMNSDPATNYEGIGIDDVHVFDKASVYSGANTDAGITQNVSGNNWVDFKVGSNVVASINPNGQNLGSTTVKVFINTSGVRHTFTQYYLDRNIVVQPANQPTDSVSVRFYFLDAEVNNLINATGCPGCTTISDAYQSGVTQYSKAPSEEDSTLNNNVSGLYNYILPHTQVSVVPYDNGYYAEYKVGGFSEFWINNGGPGQNQALPLVLVSFTATKILNTQGLLKWSIAEGVNLNQFIVEKSTDGINYTDIGVVSATGSSSGSYQFIDEGLYNGINYYRLRITNVDGSFQYSPVRTIAMNDDDFLVAVFPNPISKGNLNITTSANCNTLQLCDASGRIVRFVNTLGLQNTLSVDGLSKGVYLLMITTDAGKKIEKIIVE
ncbi:MAG: S8 family serine peptidase [Bacteroidetes bacterium]|nr:S8 family serine peptidase [Bacteroidota bacterium]